MRKCANYLIGKHAILRRKDVFESYLETHACEFQESDSDGCTVWGFQLCKALANSKFRGYAAWNTESVATICIFLYLLVLWPEWDFVSGRAAKRTDILWWIKNYDLNN